MSGPAPLWRADTAGPAWGDLVARAWRRWPIGLAVAAVTAVIGLAMIWQSPQEYVSRATVFPPATVTSAAAGQRYVTDMQAAINSPEVRRDVAGALGLSPSAFGDQMDVRRLRQSTVMEVVMRSPDRLDDPGDAIERLVVRAGQSLAMPDIAAAQAQVELSEEAVTAAEDAAVTATQAREAFLADRNGVPPSAELDGLGLELAELRLCARGVVVPPGGSAETCTAELDRIQPEVLELARADDELIALDRELARAEDDVAEAERERRDAQASATRAAAGPVVEVSRLGTKVSAVPELVRKAIAVVAGALLLGVAVMVALALFVPAPTVAAAAETTAPHRATGEASSP